MGTRGYLIWRYRRRYYVFYNPYDSYPKGLGDALFRSIPEDSVEFEKWLEAKKTWLSSLEATLEEVLTITEADLIEARLVSLEKLPSSETRLVKKGLNAVADDRLDLMPSYFPASPDDTWIEWMYTIDLDLEVLTVDQSFHFCLRKLPRSTWLSGWTYGAETEKTFDYTVVPADSIASLVAPLQAPCDEYSRNLTIESEDLPVESNDPALDFKDLMIKSKDLTLESKDPSLESDYLRTKSFSHFPYRMRPAVRLLNMLWQPLKSWLEDISSVTLRSLQPTDFLFRECAFAIVRLAGGLNGGLTFVEYRKIVRGSSPEWVTMCSHESHRTAVISGLGSGFHKEGVQPGSAPAETIYWYGSVLVRLARFLNNTSIAT